MYLACLITVHTLGIYKINDEKKQFPTIVDNLVRTELQFASSLTLVIPPNAE